MNAPIKTRKDKTKDSKPGKTVTEIRPDIHARLTEQSNKTSISMKRLGSMLLDYALGKLSKGELDLTEPALVEVDSDKNPN